MLAASAQSVFGVRLPARQPLRVRRVAAARCAAPRAAVQQTRADAKTVAAIAGAAVFRVISGCAGPCRSSVATSRDAGASSAGAVSFAAPAFAFAPQEVRGPRSGLTKGNANKAASRKYSKPYCGGAARCSCSPAVDAARFHIISAASPLRGPGCPIGRVPALFSRCGDPAAGCPAGGGPGERSHSSPVLRFRWDLHDDGYRRCESPL